MLAGTMGTLYRGPLRGTTNALLCRWSQRVGGCWPERASVIAIAATAAAERVSVPSAEMDRQLDLMTRL